MIVYLHNMSGHVLTRAGLLAAQAAADRAAETGEPVSVVVETTRAGLVRMSAKPSGVLEPHGVSFSEHRR